MYHRIAEESFDPWGTAVSPAHFADHLEWLARNRTVLPLARLAELHRSNSLPPNAVAITFDDGYHCNAEVAAPMLEQSGLPATIFLPVEWVEKEAPYWWDELEEIILEHDRPSLTLAERKVELGDKSPHDRRWRFGSGPRTKRQRAFDQVCRLLSSRPPDEVELAMDEFREQRGSSATPAGDKRPMTAQEARATASPLIHFGSHGLRHPWLPSLSAAEKRIEIGDSLDRCEAITGAGPSAFAYPFGSLDEEFGADGRRSRFCLRLHDAIRRRRRLQPPVRAAEGPGARLHGRRPQTAAQRAVIGQATRLWLGLWTRAAPRAKASAHGLVVSPFVSGAPMRALLAWRPDWKTQAVGRILQHRRGAFIDVGANVGQSLMDFLSAPVRSTYLGFEPNLTCFQHLAKLISVNGLDQCRVIPAALGERSGVSLLYRYGGDVDLGATMLRDQRPGLRVTPDDSCVYRLDDLGDLIEPEVALIKIDVEGGELEAMRGMEETLARSRAWVLCEVLHRDEAADAELHRQRCGELLRFVARIGYEVHWLVQDSNGTTVRALEPISAFPDEVWDDERSAHACDYLFVPSGEAEAARKVLAR